MVVRGASAVLFSPSLSPAGHQPEINACKHPMDKPTAFGLVTQCSQEKQPRGQLEPPLALSRWQQDSAKPPAVHWYHWDHCYGISPTCCSVCVALAIKSLPSSSLLLQMEVWAAPHCGCRQQRVGDTNVHAESSLQIDALPWQIPGLCIWKACIVLCWHKLCGVQNIV